MALFISNTGKAFDGVVSITIPKMALNSICQKIIIIIALLYTKFFTKITQNGELYWPYRPKIISYRQPWDSKKDVESIL